MNPKGARTQDAAYAFVLARKNALRVDDAGQATGASGEEIARRQRKLVEAFDAYLRYVPNGPEVAKIKFRRARAFYEMNDHAAAAPAFVALADAHPDDELAVYAQNLHLDSLNLLRRRDDLCAAAARFAGSPAARRDAEHARGLARIAADCGKRGAAMPGPGARR
jgi:hypothetical protein